MSYIWAQNLSMKWISGLVRRPCLSKGCETTTFLWIRVCRRELMSKHVTGLNAYAGMQVNHSSQLEALSLKQSGLLPILLITHENEESGCCEDWLFCGPCYFSRDLQWNVFYPHWGCCAGQLLSHWTMVVLIIERLRRRRPKTTRADSLHHFTASFFQFLTVGMFVPRYSHIIARRKRQNKA